ncbi:MAG: PASTA domain-containing protein [Mailhella sp.]|nr:PASTA domain-containing protein [Mailhella sp.]
MPSATEIISHSSNIGSAKIGLKLGAVRFHNYLSKLGFGKKTGVGIHESRGILRRTRDWSELDLMSTSFGQSISVTGVQMLQAYTALADGGLFRPLSIVLDDGETQQSEPVRIFSQKTANEVIKMMEEVVDGNGTGSKARIPGLRVAGKTGTAQKAARRGKGYSQKRLASFGGIVPADAPRYVIYVMLDEPTTTGYGGAIAAPVFQKVATRTLAYSGYLPDVTFALADEQKKNAVKQKKLTPAQRAQQKKDEIYLANLAKYRKDQEKKQKAERKTAAAPASDPAGFMPDLCGLSLRRSMEACAQRGLIPQVKGSGTFVVRQSPAPGSKLQKSSTCTVWLSDKAPVKEIITASKD